MTDAFLQHFEQLDQLLNQHRHYWQLRSFEPLSLPWPQLQPWFDSHNTEQIRQLAQDDQARAEALCEIIPQAKQLWQLGQFENPVYPKRASPPARFSNHIPGRKWAQILAFDQGLTDHQLPFLEWCAGKGHLGRLLAFRHQQPVTSLELQPQLSQHGQQLADAAKLPCDCVAQDVMAPDAITQLKPKQHAVALHACGKLHIRLLEAASQQQTQALSLSPCCYHLIDEEHYAPLSQVAQSSQLRLSKADLKLSVQETVTAGQREQRLRQQQLAWRLGFDLLQRQLRQQDEYLNCPNVPQSLMSGRFSEFCQWLAEKKQLQLPGSIDYDRIEQQGYQRVALVEQIELVQQLFRRPLEAWLVIDRALYLTEQGYQVSIEQFCDRQLTPRNLLIQAHRQPPSDIDTNQKTDPSESY